MAVEQRFGCWSAEAEMRMFGNRSHIIAGGLAAALALASGASATATPVSTGPAMLRASAPSHVAAPRWHGVRVPAGILAGVPTGSIPGGPRLRPSLAPFPVGFAADPYYSPPAAVVAPPPILYDIYDTAPVWLPFDGGCFVPSDNVGQHGYFGSCAESFYRQWMSRPD
jgi:hypothetical protein